MENRSRVIRVVSIIGICVMMGISIWFGSAYASSESFHHEDIAYLESKQNNAKALSASASAVSVLVSMLPEDTATPMANQIADIGRDFMIVLSALAAEQSLLTITGRITFCWIIPISLGILILFVLLKRKLFLQIGVKLALTGCVLFMLVPLTLRITRLADSAYHDAVDTSLQQSQEIENAFHYNENGVIMPGMDDGTAAAETEPAAVTESQTEIQPVIQTELHTEDQPVIHTETQSGTQTEARPVIHTDTQTEIRPEAVQTEAAQVLTETPVREQSKKQAKKLPWYKRLWNTITGTDSAETQTEAVQARAETPVREQSKKQAKKLPWYERLWNTITGAESVEAQSAVHTESESGTQTEAQTAIHTNSQAEIRTEAIQTEGIQTLTEAAVKEQPETKASELPWYERLWNSVSGTATTVADKASRIPGKVTDTASGVVDKISETASAAAAKASAAGEKAGELAALTLKVPQMAADLLDSLIDAFVLMIVTTCVLPIIVLIGLLWIVNQLLDIHLDWEKMTL